MFTQQDIEQIITHGQTLQEVEKQVECFRKSFPFLTISRAAVSGDGMLRLDAERIDRLRSHYRTARTQRKVLKFVPASGAATRMFKALFEYLQDDKPNAEVTELLSNLDRFAFAGALEGYLDGDREPRSVVAAIVADGLGYGALPKGLIQFHRYAAESRTAFEEHLAEGAMYAVGAGGKVCIHFTVSPEHRAAFEQLAAQVVTRYEQLYEVKYDLDYSFQKSSTDTLAVNPDNTPFRDVQGRLLFRPAGHGALIENLNEMDADLIFIKTVDNVAPDRLKEDTVSYKEALAGLLLELQQRCFDYIEELDRNECKNRNEMLHFITVQLAQKLPASFAEQSEEQQIQTLRERLDRPIRICGMVRNEGEPGGGPFWVTHPDGSESLQIAESSQIAPQQQALMTAATHFNPVDLVCGVRNHRGEKFDLTRYIDPQTGFISFKSQQGRPLKALELPGLWNGAMARWNSVFVEVPITTFSPVKVVNDLLRPQHQS